MIDEILIWEKETDFFIAVISTMLSICFPLLIQNIQSIDTKYDSQHLVSMYCERSAYIAYKWCLGIAVVVLVVYLCCPNLLGINVSDCLRILLLSGVLVLFLSTIYMFWDVLNFIRTDRLVEMFAKNDKRPKDIIVAAWTDLMVFLIKKEKDKLAMKAYEYISYQIQKARQDQTNNIEYTAEINKSIVKVNDELCKSKERYFTIFNSIGVLTIYAGESDWKSNSDITRSNIWRCLLAQIKYGRDDFIYNHWEMAHQRYAFYAYPHRIEKDFDKNYDYNFRQFYLVLGAHILHSKRYELLRKCLFQSNAQPPHYYLTPNSFVEIFKWYVEISSDKYITHFAIEAKYPFLDNEDVFSDFVRNRIKDYLCLLFVRLTCIVPTMINDNPWEEYDDYKKTKVGIGNTLKILTDFISLLSEERIQTFMEILGVNNVLRQVIIKNTLRKYLRAFSDKLSKELKEAENDITADDNIIEEYKNTIKKHIENEAIKYDLFVKSITKIPTNSLNPLIALPMGVHLMNCSSYNIYKTETFSSDRDYSISGFAEVLASYLTSELSRCMTEFIMSRGYVKYDIFIKEAEKALDNIKNADETLLLFYDGCDWVFRNHLDVQENGVCKYKGIDVIDMKGTVRYYNHIVVLDKKYMPKLEFVEPSNSLKIKHGLKELSEGQQLYWGYTELKDNEELRKEIGKHRNESDEELKKYSSLYIHLYAKFYLPPNCIKCIIILNDDFSKQTSDLNKIKPI